MEERTIEQLLERRSQIATECETEDADLVKLQEEVKSINNELEERKKLAAEQEEHRKNVAKQNILIEKNKGEKTMELVTRDSQLYKSAWLRKVMGKELSEEQQNAMVESRAFSSANTYAVPTAIADEVVECLKKVSPLINEIDLYTAAGTIRVPYESVVAEASAHTENASISASGDALLYVDLAGTEIVKIVEVSKNALAQSELAFEQWLTRQIARKIGDAIDKKIASAIESGTWNEENEVVFASSSGISYKNLCDAVALLPAALESGAKWVMNKNTLWSHIKTIKDSTGRPIFDAEDNTLLGYPVVIDDCFNYTDGIVQIFFGNLFESLKGVKSVETEVDSNEYGAGWDKAMVSFRGYTTFDCKKVGKLGIIRVSNFNYE